MLMKIRNIKINFSTPKGLQSVSVKAYISEPVIPQNIENEQFWHVSSWEQVVEVHSLEPDKITKFRYRPEKHFREYVVRFKPTAQFDIDDMFNYFDHSPDKYEDRRKWYTW